MVVWIWAGFVLFVLLMLALDLGVFHRRAHIISTGEALAWTAIWVALALVFTGVVFVAYQHNWLGIANRAGTSAAGHTAALQFLTGYLLEKGLSLDNILVIALIFSYFSVPLAYQHRVLFWGVLGAILMRGAMIAAGSLLIARFSWIVYVFGGLLLITAIKMLIARHDNLEPERNPLVRIARRIFPVTAEFRGEHFFVVENGKTVATPLLIVLLLVESTDVLFAVDSVPAIFSVTQDPFLVFTSNIFAILGLRSLYFALAAMMGKFRYLKISLVFLLAFVGVKMLLVHHHPIPTVVSLAIISGILGVGVIASLVGGQRDSAPLESPLEKEISQLTALTYKRARKIVVLVVGATIVLVGIAMVALPGPGLIVILSGLALLATEFAWARVLLKQARERAARVTSNLTRRRRQTSEVRPTKPDEDGHQRK
ncbi:MAG: TerC/Alx family metal homeostasis membrane protein [Deltaproteobacteria bacterium]|nr:TerC/Alx family metal homeostasis membrane protein [Deltaproteobacteria bacterium]